MTMKFARSISILFILNFFLLKKFFWDINIFKFFISDIFSDLSGTSLEIITFLNVKCGEGKISYLISDETLKLILNSFKSLALTLF